MTTKQNQSGQREPETQFEIYERYESNEVVKKLVEIVNGEIATGPKLHNAAVNKLIEMENSALAEAGMLKHLNQQSFPDATFFDFSMMPELKIELLEMSGGDQSERINYLKSRIANRQKIQETMTA